MKIFQLKNNFVKYTITMFVLFFALFMVTITIGEEKENRRNSIVSKSNISDSTDMYEIDVDYPRYKSDKINSIITDYIYNYVKEFKKDKTQNKTLKIDYEIFKKDNYSNIVFYIYNNVSNINRHNIVINTKEEKKSDIFDMFKDIDISKKLTDIVYSKYQKSISDKVLSSNKNNFTYIVSEEEIIVYFDGIEFDNISYEPVVKISLNKESNTFKEYDSSKKFIAFTFDDGPSSYTLDILNTLELNESSATFFMLGTNMINYEDTVLKVYNSNSEVGNHTYSHKDLTSIPYYELDYEISEVENIFQRITGSSIKYLRPPYGKYNETVKGFVSYPIVKWNIDPSDWLEQDSKEVYNLIINSACDGCIVVLHDIYSETNEAVKMIVPMLKSLNYEIVSVSNLIKYKNATINNDEVITKVGE